MMGMHKHIKQLINLALFFFGLPAGAAIAANVSPTGLTVMPGFGPLEWNIENDGSSNATAFTGTCKSLPGLTIDDARIDNGNTNAFDTAYTIYVDGAPFVAPNPSHLTGTTFTAGPVSMSGLNVTVEYHFSDIIQAARIRVILENPTAIDNNPSISVALNLGSDAGTVIEATSSGDLLYTTADRWVITSDGLPLTPVNTTVVYGPGTVRVVPFFTTTTVCGDPGPTGDPTGIGYSFNITVPANATRQLMFFAGLGDIVGPGNTITGAIANVTMFDNNNNIDPSLLAGIPAGDLGEILNWAFTNFVALGGGGGGGCTLASRYALDPTLWLYVLISAAFLGRRRRHR